MDKLLTTEEAARVLGVCVETVRRHLAAGKLRGYKIGPRLWRINAADLPALVGAGEGGGADE